ncbi:hypothetical protein CMI48_00085 [Candidatus Pacearchaeota archaeon]|nr:hypothetical protein [Candidatus Pacearchaeota archaeon]|tara:strand:- start:192 stop:491 length:300 start_codon:yes stop_codon:yes gene_type:complete
MKYTFRNYIAYLKDNPKGYWFKRKLYGWGWAPATKEGFFVLTAFILILIKAGFSLENNGNPTTFIWILILSIAALIAIGYKTGEPPKWTWGRSENQTSP